ncbi:hypothetical protein [Dyadobacter psychrotolerans]|uniref:YARHG domain-containing protein n=1 Tax=Dyadobacter psychrotolerans TaxID=2541721 RepID=A0A4R5DDT2_9BACT|nr:hypothetical protein [Dyadobacter psychrotolerans]TDE11986.1 hypothetical protein E0F88_23310 [Dyadobacter psychrotolerans]
MRVFTIVLSVLVLKSVCSFGQTASSEPNGISLETPPETSYPVSLYKTATAQSQNLYNGRLYYIYDSRMEEHQFFEERKWKKGIVFYEGQRFDSVALMYDLVRDELVIKHLNGDPMLLQSEKVDYFWNEGHTFKRFESGKDITPQMRTGFYDLVYNGESQLLVRRTKQRQEKIVDKRVIAYFPEKSFFYIRKNGKYNFVRSKKSVLALFPEYKKQLRKALRDENIAFRPERETAIAKMVATYDALAKP